MKRILLALAFCLLAAVPASAQVKPATLVPAATQAITSGGTWQLMFAQNTNRYTLWVENYCTTTSQNIGSTESLFIYFQQGTTVPSGNPWTIGAFELAACGSQVFSGTSATTQAVYVWATTTAHAFAGWQNQ